MDTLMQRLRKVLRRPPRLSVSEDDARPVDVPLSPHETLPSLADNAYGQRAVFDLLVTISDNGLSVREIAEHTSMTWNNADEKLKKLKNLGYVEEVPGSSPRHWRLTREAKVARSAAGHPI